MGKGSIDLAALFVEILLIEPPVKNGFENIRFAPEHGSGGELEMALSLDVIELKLI